MTPDYPEEPLLARNQMIVQEVLGPDAIQINIQNLIIEESFVTKTSKVICYLHISGKEVTIEDVGNGVIDALFNAFLSFFSDKYVSLRTIELHDFIVKVEPKNDRNLLSSDALIEVKVVLNSGERTRLYFKAKTDSLIMSSAQAVVNAVEYLINAELAAVRLSKDTKAAKKRKRIDLENSYICKLSELVKIVSYSEAMKIADK